MKTNALTVTLLALVLAADCRAATPLAGPAASFLVDPVTGSLVRCEGAALSTSASGTLAGLHAIAQESAGLVSARDAKSGTIEVLVGAFADEGDAGIPVIRSSSGGVLLARGMSPQVDRVLTAESALSWDGTAVWKTTYTPTTPVPGEGAQPATRGTRTFLSLRIADQRTFEQQLPRGAAADIAALSFDDVLLALQTGGLLRYKTGKLLWQLDAMPGGFWQIRDSDLKRSMVLVTDEDGGVAAVDMNAGTLLWRWHGPSSAQAMRTFLHQTRSQATLDADHARASESATKLAAEGWIAEDAVSDEVLRTEYGAVDARFAPNGKVLITGNPLAPWAALFDPATHAPVGRELIDSLALAGHASAAEAYRTNAVGLGVDLLVLPAGPDGAPVQTLLFKSPEGWFTAPLSVLN